MTRIDTEKSVKICFICGSEKKRCLVQNNSLTVDTLTLRKNMAGVRW